MLNKKVSTNGGIYDFVIMEMNKKISLANVKLKSKRLILRPWKESDLDDFFEYASMDIVAKMAGWPAHKIKEESKGIL